MRDNTNSTGLNFPSELRWRIAILAALVVIVPVLRHGGALSSKPSTVAAAALPASTDKGWGMAGILPGVSPITFGGTLQSVPVAPSPSAG